MIVRRFAESGGSAYFRKLSVIVFTAIAILFSALYLLFAVKNESKNEVYMQFVEHADRIAENFNERLHADLLALHSFSIAATSYALDTKSSWPMITIPDFAVKSWTTRQEMKAETLGILPIVTAEQREQWERYSTYNRDWLEQSRLWEEKSGKTSNSGRRLEFLDETPMATKATVQKEAFIDETPMATTANVQKNVDIDETPMATTANFEKEVDVSYDISWNIYAINTEGEAMVDVGMGPYSPVWMTSPAPTDSRMINFNLLSHHLFSQAIEDCLYSRLSVMSRVVNFEAIENSDGKVIDEPMSSILYPVFENFEENSNLVAIVAAEIYWHDLLDKSLPDSATEIICVVESACGQTFSFQINGGEVSFLGVGDYHDPLLNKMVQTRGPKELILDNTDDFPGTPLDPTHCQFLLHVYPASRMEENQSTFGIISLVLCLLAICVFPISLFFYFGNPSSEFEEDDIETAKAHSTDGLTRQKTSIRDIPKLWKKQNMKTKKVPQRAKEVIESMPEQMSLIESKEEIVLTNSTLMVAGLCSLEQWKEGKEPEETDHLLETVERSILAVAKRHGISQVEMIDGKFIAIMGSDNNDIDHAAILVYFACECRKRVSELFKSMAAKELSIRFGIHSGNLIPEITTNDNGSSRFQLFGDTVDTAYQMLENGKANRIQVSVDTAELLNLAGKPHWISPRSDLIPVKGIGNMSTFWVKPKACLSTGKAEHKSDDDSVSTVRQRNTWEGSFSVDDVSEKDFQSLVDQNTAILLRYLRAIYAKRLVSKKKQILDVTSSWERNDEMGRSIIEEARESIQATSFDFSASMDGVDPSLVQISQEVQSKLRNYVASIGAAHRRENHFHNFQYASHTVLVLDQMIKTMTSSSNILQSGFDGAPRSKGEIARELDSRTFSISSEPIIQFAILLSALIHDVDHMGVSNQQLVKNGSPLSTSYKKRCISEQNSVDISWWLLMKEDFDDLRSSIYSNASERRQFRQVLVNSVIATDVSDSKMKQHRESNWKKAFAENTKSKRRNFVDPHEKRNLQVTSIVECLMQVADSSFRNQSYGLYKKWNERLFEESLTAYHAGQLEVNPAMHWYKSELEHFDDFFIPLVSRIVGTGLFGGSGDSYLMQAIKNRDAWNSEGEELVREMVNRFSRKVVAVQEDTIHFT